MGSELFNLEKGRLRGDLTVFKYLKGYYMEDAEQMFFSSTGDQIKWNTFKLYPEKSSVGHKDGHNCKEGIIHWNR